VVAAPGAFAMRRSSPGGHGAVGAFAAIAISAAGSAARAAVALAASSPALNVARPNSKGVIVVSSLSLRGRDGTSAFPLSRGIVAARRFE